jgi:general secretion pathway protein J
MKFVMKTRTQRGFTLVELMVALFALALLAIMSWRGLDGMVRAQERTEARSQEVLALQVGMAQWTADLEAVVELPQTQTLDWNGRVVRMARRSSATSADAVVVVGWTRRETDGVGMWLRWQSPPVTTRGELDEAWNRADLWSQNPGDQERAGEVAIVPLAQWQIYYFRADAWTNPLSSGATSTAATPAAPGTLPSNVPDGVRLVLTLPPGQSISGEITRDWVRPTLTRQRS